MIVLSLQEMGALIRRVVKDAIHEEFVQLQQVLPGSIAVNWAHEGEEDLAGDQLLLAEALAERERCRTNPKEYEVDAMTAVAFSQFRRRLDEFFEQAEDEAVFITRADGHDPVLISKQEYKSLLETSHLLSTTANAGRLADAMGEIEAEIARRSSV